MRNVIQIIPAEVNKKIAEEFLYLMCLDSNTIKYIYGVSNPIIIKKKNPGSGFKVTDF